MAVDSAIVKSLFLAASDLPSGPERAAFLDRECNGNIELRARVQALLAADVAPVDAPRSDSVANVTLDSNAGAARPRSRRSMASSDAPGLILAEKYKLLERIGEGGMGSVWLAQQSFPVKRKVAVKLIKLGMDSKQVLSRFEAERQALAMMDHPNIAKVLDGGLMPDGRPFFVMELVKGTPITEYCDACKLSLKERLDLFVPVCQAIQHAHQKGIIHRDIKPSNVMIAMYDDRPVPKVIDFGVAKATGQSLSAETLNTGFGGVIGTPQYMSPEQATLNNLDIDTRSDVYSLGVVLYELLTGEPPFTKKDLEKKGLMEVLRVVREDEPPKPSTKLSTAAALPTLSANRNMEPRKLTQMLRSELDWIVLKALEKNRIRRYETANSLAADIQRYLSGEPVTAHPPSAAYLTRKFIRRHRAQVFAATLVLVALIAGIAGTTFGLIRANHSAAAERAAKLDADNRRAEAVQQTIRAESNAAQAAASERKAAANAADAKYQLIRRHIANGTEALEHTEQFTAILWYARAWQGDQEPLNEGTHRARLGAVLNGLPRLAGVCFHTAGVDDADIDLAGRRLVTRTMDREGHRGNAAYLWDYAAGKLIAPPLTHAAPVRFAEFSPDGTLVLTTSEDMTAATWDPATGKRLRILNHDAPVIAAAFTPDGKMVATAAGHKVLFWNPVTGESTGQSIECSDSVYSIQFNQDGSRFLTADQGNHACVWETATCKPVGQPLESLVPSAEMEAFYKPRPSLSPDGKRVLTLKGPQTQAHDVETGKLLWQVAASMYSSAWSRDEAQIFVAGSHCLMVDSDTGKILRAFPHPRLSGFLALSPDGQTLATGISGGGIYLRNPKSADFLGPPLQCADFLRRLRFSADGKRLIAASQDGTARVWELAPASPITRYQFDCGQAHLGVFADGSSASPDGRTRFRPDSQGGVLERPNLAQPLPLPHAAAVKLSRFSSDGRRLATFEGNAVRVWDAITGEPMGPVIPVDAGFDLTPRLEISSDGQRVTIIYRYREHAGLPVASKRPVAAIVWDAAGRRLFVLPSRIESGPRIFEEKEHDSVVFESVVSSDMRVIAAAVESAGEVSAFEVDSGKRLYCRPAFRGHIWSLAVQPAGRSLLTAATDGLAREFDLMSGKELGPPLRHLKTPTNISSDLDGKQLATISLDKQLRIWDTRTGDLLAIATGAAGSDTPCWFSRDGSTVQFLKGKDWFQYRIPAYAGPRGAVRRATAIISGHYLDANDGLADVGPSEFLDNRDAYRKAWLDWQGIADDPKAQP